MPSTARQRRGAIRESRRLSCTWLTSSVTIGINHDKISPRLVQHRPLSVTGGWLGGILGAWEIPGLHFPSRRPCPLGTQARVLPQELWPPLNTMWHSTQETKASNCGCESMFWPHHATPCWDFWRGWQPSGAQCDRDGSLSCPGNGQPGAEGQCSWKPGHES